MMSATKAGRTYVLALFSLLMMQATVLFAQGGRNVTKVGTTAAAFLEIGVGSRAIGMGGAFSGMADDATALYWNAAGLGRIMRNEVILVHTNWLADIRYDFAGVVVPVGGFGSIGASVTVLSMDDMAERTIARPEGSGKFFSVGDLALGLSYGISLTDRFSIGLHAKYIHQRISEMTASGFAVDIGTLFTTDFYGMRIGAVIRNFGPDMRMTGKDALVFHDIDPIKLGNNERIEAELSTASWPLPLIFQAGVAMELIQNERNRLSVALDARNPVNNTESINIGVEYALYERLFMRAGLHELFLKDGETTFTAGAGVVARMLGNVRARLDYAYADFGRLESVHRFSLAVEF